MMTAKPPVIGPGHPIRMVDMMPELVGQGNGQRSPG
jgi:hypothetical protein